MSEASIGWQTTKVRRSVVAKRRNSGILIAICLVGAMTAAEILFLRSAAAPDSANLLSAAEGIAPPP
jgi:hypothetical protein